MFSDFSVHRLTMIVVVRERVMNRCKGEVRIVLEKLFGALPVQQSCDDHRSHSDSSVLDPRAAPADGRITHNMRVRHSGHGESLTNLLLPCNPLPINRRTGHCDGMALVLGLC